MKTTNRPSGILATPAGSEMKVRMIGSMRVKKTVAEPWRSNHRSADLEMATVDVDQPVAVEQLDAPVVTGGVGDQRPDEVAQHAGRDDPEQGQVPLRRR